MCLEQNWILVDIGEEAGGGYRNLYFFADIVNAWQLTKFVYCSLLDMIFLFFASSLFALSKFFPWFCMLIKR